GDDERDSLEMLVTDRNGKLQQSARIVRRVLPWASLLTGAASALAMDRGPERAMVVAGAAIGCWVTMLAVLWIGAKAEARQTMLWRGAHFSTLALTQWALQLSLFFALPFYW